MSLKLEELQLLQRIAENTTPIQTSMISITSTSPQFSVNFPSPIPVKEIALAKLRVYHSWPNIRSVAFGGQQPNNSLRFARENKPDGTPDWKEVSIPTGSYQIEQINNEIQRRIKSITGKESKIAIEVHEPTLSSSIEINSPDYAVDIYNSSLRTVLGWPEKPPVDVQTILRYNNDPDRGGRHIAPHNVNISTVIALNLTCDVIEGSYQINLEQSNQAQQGYILYSFSPTAPPGFLITENPINPVYMRCHNNLLTRINFKLTDQSNNLIDLQEEVLAISLFVKS